MKEAPPLEMAGAKERLNRIARVVLVGSGKGGVGKSMVACGLAISLSRRGYSTGLLDLDIHGASVPQYLGVRPPLKSGKEGLVPKRSRGVEVMSIGLLTGNNPVPMRGNGKQELITQLFGLTDWGELDFLVVDLPPSMGDELLSAFGLFGPKSTFLLVTTPSPGAVAVVSRLKRLSETENIRVAGVALNMAYMGGENAKTFPFGRPDVRALERVFRSRILAEIPLEPTVSAKGLGWALNRRNDFSRAFSTITERILEHSRGDKDIRRS